MPQYFNINKMHELITENQSKYLDLNRFLNTTTPTTPTKSKNSLKYPHHASSKRNQIWSEDDRFKFENQILMFVKDITAQITNLTSLLGLSFDFSHLNQYRLHNNNMKNKRQFVIAIGS